MGHLRRSRRDVALPGRGPREARRTSLSQQEWFWGTYVPADHLTFVGSHGGASKSTIGLMLAACASVGRDCLGKPTKRSRVLFFSAEDPEALVLRRLRLVCQILGLDFDEVRRGITLRAVLPHMGPANGASGAASSTHFYPQQCL